jgi:pimeloyl-ACP methyl ester carboxylesterase
LPIARIQNININYNVEGTGDPLVMIMGLTAARSGWMSQIPAFRKHFRLITFDNRGAGKSDKPPGPYTTKMMADDVLKLMDYLGIEKAHIIGASMGGMIAQELAINYPERVLKLVLACTYARPASPEDITPEQAALAGLTDRQMSVAMVGLAFNKPLYRIVFSLLDRIQTRFISASNAAGIAGQRMACATHDTLDRLPVITAPTMVIVGTKDRIISPSASEVLAGRIPNVKLVKVKGGSHSFSLEMKKTFNQFVLDFLMQ